MNFHNVTDSLKRDSRKETILIQNEKLQDAQFTTYGEGNLTENMF